MNRAERRKQRLHPDAQLTDAVTLGYIHPGTVSAVFMDAVDRLKLYELQRRGLWLGQIGKLAGSGHLANARNFVTQRFLESPADWLLFVDADMGFPAWSLERMLGAAYSGDSFKPIIGGLCFAMSAVDWNPDNFAEVYECFPVLGIWNRDDGGTILGYRHLLEYDKDTVLHVDSTGAAFVLIHRSALETIGDHWWSQKEIPDNAPGLEGRGLFGEDISFFMRCAEHDLPVWVDTMVKTSHHKGGIYLTEETWDLQEALKHAAKAAV